MYDSIMRLGGSILQHGAYNNRIYLMKLSKNDYPGILDHLDKLAREHGYGKILAKVPDWAKDGFLAKGYQKEAHIPSFFNGSFDAYFLGKFLSDHRGKEKDPETAERVIKTASMKSRENQLNELDSSYEYRICKDSDSGKMAEVYQEVFETYPFPIYDPEYIKKTMAENIVYLGVWHDRKLIALSSVEIDSDSSSGEMTDFATLSEYRGKGFSNFLLHTAEQVIFPKGIRMAYTIARAYSFGMNITFAKRGYTYTGTLVNNTNISGKLESMNVWYKAL